MAKKRKPRRLLEGPIMCDPYGVRTANTSGLDILLAISGLMGRPLWSRDGWQTHGHGGAGRGLP